MTLRTTAVKAAARDLGADVVGIARAVPVEDPSRLLAWLACGYAAGMSYLHKWTEQRLDPVRLQPGARSIIVIGLNYYPSAADRARAGQPLRVAKYAWGRDYHTVLRRLLRRLRRRLEAFDPQVKGRICVDTAPFLDKYWAARAGIGWQGKHTNLVSRSFGSWLLIGSLIVTSDVDVYDAPQRDFCGSCTACLDACPTRAMPLPYLLDARRCLSYWTIEARTRTIPDDTRDHLQGWVFGCDICLDVCPWNKFATSHEHPDFRRAEAVGRLEAGQVESVSAAEFDRLFAGSALARPGLEGTRRNIDACTSAPI